MLFCLLLTGLAVVLGSYITTQTIAIAKRVDQGDEFAHVLHLLDMRIGRVFQVSDEPIMSCCLSWSPDGNKIVFTGDTGQLFIWNMETKETSHLSSQGFWGYGTPLWLDNQTIFHTLNDNVFRFDVDSNDLHQLTFFTNKRIYVWDKSPDKTFLLFSVGTQAFGLSQENYHINTDGTGLQELGDTVLYRNSVPQISPDGKQIAYIIERGGRWDIAIMDTEGNNSQQLTRTRDFETIPLWSPDGKYILYESFLSSNQIINIMDADGSNQRAIVPQRLISTFYPNFVSNPVWSPDGRQIIFDAAISNLPDSGSILYVMDADGSNLRELYRDNQTSGLSPAWQPQP